MSEEGTGLGIGMLRLVLSFWAVHLPKLQSARLDVDCGRLACTKTGTGEKTRAMMVMMMMMRMRMKKHEHLDASRRHLDEDKVVVWPLLLFPWGRIPTRMQ